MWLKTQPTWRTGRGGSKTQWKWIQVGGVALYPEWLSPKWLWVSVSLKRFSKAYCQFNRQFHRVCFLREWSIASPQDWFECSGSRLIFLKWVVVIKEWEGRGYWNSHRSHFNQILPNESVLWNNLLISDLIYGRPPLVKFLWIIRILHQI